MSSPLYKGSNSDRSKTITWTNIEPCAPPKKRQPTFAENWEAVSEERIIKLVNSTKLKTKPQPVSSKRSSPNKAVACVLSTTKLSEGCSSDTLNSKKELEVNEVANHASSSSAQSGYNGRFSFYERHKDWMSQTRRRMNGRYDKFYYHRMGNWVFRSKIEVTNFVLYEMYPKRSQKQKRDETHAAVRKNKSNDMTNEDMMPQGFEDGRRGSPSKRKWAPTPDEALAKSVEQFLAEAYTNFMNLDKTTAPSSEAKHNSNAEEGNCRTPGPSTGNNENVNDDAQKRGVSRILDTAAAGEELAVENLDEDFTQMPLDQDFDSLFKCIYTYVR